MNLMERTAAELAGHLAERVARRLVRVLQAQEAGLQSDSGMKNLWDEICVQTRTDSAWSDSYVDFMRPKLEAIIASLHRHEQMALWLQTYAGQCFWTTARMEGSAMPRRLYPPWRLPAT